MTCKHFLSNYIKMGEVEKNLECYVYVCIRCGKLIPDFTNTEGWMTKKNE